MALLSKHLSVDFSNILNSLGYSLVKQTGFRNSNPPFFKSRLEDKGEELDHSGKQHKKLHKRIFKNFGTPRKYQIYELHV